MWCWLKSDSFHRYKNAGLICNYTNRLCDSCFSSSWLVSHWVYMISNFFTPKKGWENNSEFAICRVVRHGNVNSITVQNHSTVSNSTMGPYCILLPLTLPCRSTWQIANSLLFLCKLTLKNDHIRKCKIKLDRKRYSASTNKHSIGSRLLILKMKCIGRMSGLYVWYFIPEVRERSNFAKGLFGIKLGLSV